MDGKRFQNASDVVSFCESKQMEGHVAYPNAKRQVSRFFHLVKPKDVGKSAMWDCKNILGTQSLHFFALVSHRDVTLLNLKEHVTSYVTFQLNHMTSDRTCFR
jgi:hypothetical protein